MATAAEGPFLDTLGRLGPALLQSLDALERARRRLHPPDLPSLRAAMAPLRPRLDAALGELGQVAAPPGIEGLREELARAGAAAARALARHTAQDAESIARAALGIASEICIYTNDHISLVALP